MIVVCRSVEKAVFTLPLIYHAVDYQQLSIKSNQSNVEIILSYGFTILLAFDRASMRVQK